LTALVALATLWGGCQSEAARDDGSSSDNPEAASGDGGEVVEARYAGKAVFRELVHDFGKVYPEEKTLRHIFRFRNESEKSLRIQNVSGS
jgi:hypothetical protein